LTWILALSNSFADGNRCIVCGNGSKPDGFAPIFHRFISMHAQKRNMARQSPARMVADPSKVSRFEGQIVDPTAKKCVFRAIHDVFRSVDDVFRSVDDVF
jgi:hypothetical protein